MRFISTIPVVNHLNCFLSYKIRFPIFFNILSDIDNYYLNSNGKKRRIDNIHLMLSYSNTRNIRH